MADTAIAVGMAGATADILPHPGAMVAPVVVLRIAMAEGPEDGAVAADMEAEAEATATVVEAEEEATVRVAEVATAAVVEVTAAEAAATAVVEGVVIGKFIGSSSRSSW